MAHLFSRSLVASALLVLGSLACAQDALVAADGTDGPPSFAIRIEAPAEVTNLLERHLELQRYKVLPDLSDAEIQSLMLKAQQDATELLATLGYFSPDIRITLESPPDAATAKGRAVHIVVQPGAQTRVALVNLQLQGAIAQDPEAQEQRQAVRDLWSLDTGEPFSQAAWDNAKSQALKQLLARRFPTARLLSSHAEVDPDTASANLELQLDSGPAYRIGSLVVEGSQRYSADLVRRFARLRPGEDYELAELVEAQRRMTDSGYYDSAYLSLDTDGDPAKAVVRAQVKEASMQKAVFGVGATTDSGFRLSAEHTYNQVPGIDWRAVNKLTVARDKQTFASDWTSQPGENQWRWAAAALFERERVDEIDLLTQRYRAGRFTTDVGLDQNYYLQFERTQATYRELDQSVTNEAVSANYAFALRRFDSTPFPSSGWGVGGEIAAGTVLGTKQEPFTRVLLRALAYQPLGQSLENLFERQHAGRIVYRAQAGGVVVDDATSIPFNQLFLTGGDTTVRGYKYQEIGVTHNGILTAESGRYLATAGIEWQRPIVRKGLMTDWESAVFVDTGAVANRVEEFSFKSGVGVGARWKSPVGPLQIDLAYGLATQALRLHLNVGFVF
jgi:translocation and assembly module TamA